MQTRALRSTPSTGAQVNWPAPLLRSSEAFICPEWGHESHCETTGSIEDRNGPGEGTDFRLGGPGSCYPTGCVLRGCLTSSHSCGAGVVYSPLFQVLWWHKAMLPKPLKISEKCIPKDLFSVVIKHTQQETAI